MLAAAAPATAATSAARGGPGRLPRARSAATRFRNPFISWLLRGLCLAAYDREPEDARFRADERPLLDDPRVRLDDERPLLDEDDLARVREDDERPLVLLDDCFRAEVLRPLDDEDDGDEDLRPLDDFDADLRPLADVLRPLEDRDDPPPLVERDELPPPLLEREELLPPLLERDELPPPLLERDELPRLDEDFVALGERDELAERRLWRCDELPLSRMLPLSSSISV
jgi:hypothetical protein